MDFEEYSIETIHKQNHVVILKAKPKTSSSVFAFLPGQFAQIKNPGYKNPHEAHLFSIASSPHTKDHLEFCVKVYGFWTQAVSKLKTGDSLSIRGPFGKFVWNSSLKNAVFLIGGVGITPVLSMLRFISEEKTDVTLVLFYGNRTKDSIAYKEELELLAQKISTIKIVHILSDLKPYDTYEEYKGFITQEIIQKEADLSLKPIFFLCGPPIFVQKMRTILRNLSTDESRIKQEMFT